MDKILQAKQPTNEHPQTAREREILQQAERMMICKARAAQNRADFVFANIGREWASGLTPNTQYVRNAAELDKVALTWYTVANKLRELGE